MCIVPSWISAVLLRHAPQTISDVFFFFQKRQTHPTLLLRKRKKTSRIFFEAFSSLNLHYFDIINYGQFFFTLLKYYYIVIIFVLFRWKKKTITTKFFIQTITVSVLIYIYSFPRKNAGDLWKLSDFFRGIHSGSKRWWCHLATEEFHKSPIT